MPRRALFGAILVLLAPVRASAETPQYARAGSVVIGSDTTLFAGSAVPRREPYYAYRNERRHVVSVRAVLDAFVLDRFSLGAATTLSYARSDTAGSATYLSLSARIGYVLGTRSFALWPGLSAGLVYRGTTAATVAADLRAVFPLTDTILFTIGPRIEREVGRSDRETTTSLVFGLAGAARLDEVTEHRDRGFFGVRRMHVVDVQFATSARAIAGSDFTLASTRASLGLDGFLWPGASIGSYLAVQSDGSSSARLNAFVAGARIGQAIIFSDRLWWWARFAVEVSRADAAGASPRSVLQLVVDAPFVAAIAPGVGIGIGPWFALPVIGAHARTTSVGVASSMVFYGF